MWRPLCLSLTLIAILGSSTRADHCHLNERQAERSPHERVDDGIDARVDVGQTSNSADNEQRVLESTVDHDDACQLIGQPRHAERRRNGQAHPGHSASGRLLVRRRIGTS